MLTKEQLRILGVFREDVSRRLTFKDIKEKSKQKSNNTVQIALKQFLDENLVRTQMTGDVTTYYLNFDNNLTLSYLNLINELEIYENRKLPKKILEDIQKRILKYSEFFVLIVFGSYAENKATQKSDVDIAIIVECGEAKKDIAPYVETVKRREIVNIDYHVFTRNEFIEMLLADDENVGKEIYRKNVVFYGLIEYYNMIKGVKHERIG
ncbi:MAG: nucleotidyltransferase domain-containing protein [archaeon]